MSVQDGRAETNVLGIQAQSWWYLHLVRGLPATQDSQPTLQRVFRVVCGGEPRCSTKHVTVFVPLSLVGNLWTFPAEL